VRQPPLGAHVSTAGGVSLSIRRGEELGCQSIQVFVTNPLQWAIGRLLKTEIEAFREARRRSALCSVIAHASYLINLGAPDRQLLQRSRRSLLQQLERCDRLGIDALVVHPGAHMGRGSRAGIERVGESLEWILGRLEPNRCRLLLENTAGQGTVLGSTLEEIATMLEIAGSEERLGACLDTCHAFAAGYPIHRRTGLADFVDHVDANIGLERVGCLHLNDSRGTFAARRDRHSNIGEGEIGIETFRRILAEKRLAAIPMILETPVGRDGNGHERDLLTLRSLLSSRPRPDFN
jgi:deoxyribonuclease-4